MLKIKKFDQRQNIKTEVKRQGAKSGVDNLISYADFTLVRPWVNLWGIAEKATGLPPGDHNFSAIADR